MTQKRQSEVLVDIIEGLNQAIGATSQMIHSQGNPVAFMTMREALMLSKEGILELTQFDISRTVITGV